MSSGVLVTGTKSQMETYDYIKIDDEKYSLIKTGQVFYKGDYFVKGTDDYIMALSPKIYYLYWFTVPDKLKFEISNYKKSNNQVLDDGLLNRLILKYSWLSSEENQNRFIKEWKDTRVEWKGTS